MSSNRLRLNPGKTQFIWVGTRGQLSKIDLSYLQHHFPGISFSTTVRDLGVILDQELTFSEHVRNVCRTCFYHLRQIRSVRRSLTSKAATTLMHAFIMHQSRLWRCYLCGLNPIAHKSVAICAKCRGSADRRHTKVRAYISGFIREELHWL